MDLPDNVQTGIVTGRYIVDVIDGADANLEPDAVSVQGRIVFTASVPYLQNPAASPAPVTIMRAPIIGVLDADGYLCTPYPGTLEPLYRGVHLIATDDPDLVPQNWTWDVTYMFDPVGGKKLDIPPHGFALPTGSTVDLTNVAKVPSSPGYSLPQAEAAVLRAEQAAQQSADDAADAVAAALRAEQAAGATDQGVASMLADPATETGQLMNDFLSSKANVTDVNAELQDKADKVATESALSLKADAASINSSLAGKADLQFGVVPIGQLPSGSLVNDENIAGQVNAPQTGAAIDARINTQVTPVVEQITADYIASDPAVVDAAAAAVDANPKIASIEAANSTQDARLAHAERKLPETADLDDRIFTVTDKDGKETWVSARKSDGGPSDWAMQHLTERLGVLSNKEQGYLFALVDDQERMTDLSVRASDGQIPDWVMDRWRNRLGISQPSAAQGAGVSTPMVPILQSIAAGVERHVAGAALQPASIDFMTGDTNDEPARLFFPARYNDVRPMPLVISFMGIGSTIGSHWSYTDLREKMEEAGALMGGGEYGGDLYGAPQMLASAREVYEKALRIAPVSGVVIFGNSMGGIGALNALTSGAIPNVLGVYLTDPAFDLRQRYENGREAEIQAAYGIASDGSDYTEKTEGYDPAIRPTADFQGVPIRIYSSSGDTLWADHTVKILERLGQSNDIEVHNTGTAGHNTLDRFNGTDLAAFVTKCVDGPTGLRL